MSEPIKVVVTAETAQAAAALQAFVATAGNGLDVLKKKGKEAADGMGSNRMALMELGHSARSMADGLAAGMNPFRLMMMEAPRLTQAVGEASAELRTKIMGFLPALGGIGAAIAAGAVLWHYYGDAMTDPTKRARELADALEKVPGLLEKIATAQRAGVLSPEMADKYKNMLSGQTPLYNQTTINDAFGGHASTVKNGAMGLFGEAFPQLTTDPNLRNSRTGQIIGQRQPANESDITQYVSQMMRTDHTTMANDNANPANAELAKLHDLETKMQRDSEIGIQKEIDRIRDRYAIERREAAETRDAIMAEKKWTPEEEQKYQAGMGFSQTSEQQSIDELKQKAAAESAQQIVEAQNKLREQNAKVVADQIKLLESQITDNEVAEAGKRGATYVGEYVMRTALYAKLLLEGKMSEDEFGEKAAEAANKAAEAQKKYVEQLERTEEHQHAIAQGNAQLALEQIKQNPFLTDPQKQQQSIAPLQQMMVQNDTSISDQTNIANNSTDDSAREQAFARINDLMKEQFDLQTQLNAAQNANNFGYQLGETITKLQSQNTLAQQAADIFGGAYTTAVNSLTKGFSGLIEGTMTKAQAMREIYNSVLNEIVEGFVKMGLEWVLQNTLMTAVSAMFHINQNAQAAASQAVQISITAAGTTSRIVIRTGEAAHDAAMTGLQVSAHGTGEGTKTIFTLIAAGARSAIRLVETTFHGVMAALRTAVHIASEIACTAVTLPQAMIRSLARMVEAAVGAMAAEASIPYVGPVLAVVAAAGIVAAAMALMGGFQSGGYTGDGAPDEVAGLVHRGEFVVDAATVNRVGVENLEAMRSGRADSSSATAVNTRNNSNGPQVHNAIYFDRDAMANELSKSDAHEKNVVDVMRRHIHKFS